MIRMGIRMTRYKASVLSTKAQEKASRASIGGSAILPSGLSIPSCRNCGTHLLLFLQFDVEASWGLPFVSGSHFVLFMCPNCNDIPSFNDYADGKLPATYWDSAEGHFLAALSKPGKEVILPQQPLLDVKELQFSPFKESGHAPGAILVGEPAFWLQNSRTFHCCCGAEMRLILQIAENLGFDKSAHAPPQANSFSNEQYCLFLGNEIYVFGCPRQCHPRSVWITVQG